MRNLDFKWDIIGHKPIVKFLQNNIRNDKISHAYLFSGSEGVGKTRVVEYFIASLLCHQTESIPCKKCIFCQQVFKKIHPDLIWIEKDPNKKNITIEQIRNLREKLTRRSFLDSYKIAVVNEAETLTQEAWNALLKTLEEPSEKTIIILITTNLKGIPSTIISRCQLIKFLTINQQEIYNHLMRDLKVPVKKAEILSHLCRGRPGIAIKFINDKKLLEKYEIEAKSLFGIIEKDRLKDKFSYLDTLVKPKMDFLKTRESFQNLLSIWTLVLRDCLLIKTSNSDYLVNNFIKQEINELAQKYSLSKIKVLLQKFIQTKNYFYYNINPRLAIENLIIQI